MNERAPRPVRLGASGLAAGAIVTATIVLGEAQIRSAAAGSVSWFGSSRTVLVDPLWASVGALALALVVFGMALLAGQVLAAGRSRGFWLGAVVVPAGAVLIGVALGGGPTGPEQPAVEELLTSAARSPLLLLVVVATAFFAWVPSTAATPGSPAAGR